MRSVLPLIAKATLVLFTTASALGGCGPSPSTATPAQHGSGGTCSAAHIEQCEHKIALDLARQDLSRNTVADYLYARKQIDPNDPWVQLFDQLSAASKASPAIKAIWIDSRPAAAGSSRPSSRAYAAITAKNLTAPAHLSQEELLIAIGQAFSLHSLFYARDDYTLQLFINDPLYPFLVGLTPAVLAEGDTASADSDIGIDTELRLAFEAAAAFQYVNAARHADLLRELVVKRPNTTGSSLRARFALDLLASAGVSLEPAKDAPDLVPLDTIPPDLPHTPAYHELLWVRTAANPSQVFQSKGPHILAGIRENKEQTKKALLSSIYRKTGDCSPGPLPLIEYPSDLIFTSRLASSLARPDHQPDASHLALPDWYVRYTAAVNAAESSRSFWSYAPNLLFERGQTFGLDPAKSDTHVRMTQLAQQHLKALLALEREAPDRFRTFSQLALVFNPGLLGDQKLREQIIELTRAGAQDKIALAKDAQSVFDGVLAGVFAGISFPPAIQEAYMTGLAGAFSAKLKGDLSQKTGWGVAGLYAGDAVYRLLADQNPNLDFSSGQVSRALLGDTSIAYPGLAAISVSAARYLALGFSGRLAVLPKDSPKVSAERKAAKDALKSAIAALAEPGGEAPDNLLSDITELADGLIAVISTSFQASRQRSAKQPESCPNPNLPFVSDPETRRALDKLGDLRRQILAHPRIKSGQDAWAQRSRMLVLILSDAMDIASKREGKTKFSIGSAGAESIVKEALSGWSEREAALAITSGYGAVRALLEAKDAEQFVREHGKQISDVVKGLSLFFKSGDEKATASKPAQKKTLLDALATAPLGTSSDLLSICLSQAELLYSRGEADQGDLWLLATLVISGLQEAEPSAKATALAAQHSKRVEWALRFLTELEKTRNGIPPNVEAYAPGMKQAMDDACVAAANADDMLSAMGAVRLWMEGKRDDARATLDSLLDSIESKGLSVPKMTYKYEEKTETKILSVSLGISYGGGLLNGSNSFQIGLGIKSKGEPGGAMSATLSSSDGAEAASDSARFYVHASALATVYHFLSGDVKRATKSAQRAVSILSTGARLGDRLLAEPDPGKWASDATTALALSAQLAAEANLPFLAGDLWTLLRASLPKDADDEAISKLLQDAPFGLGKTPELPGILERTKRSLRVVAAPLACTNAKVALALYEEPACDGYAHALSLRIADVLQKLPHIGRADPKTSAKCAVMKSLDGFLGSMDKGTYDPDALMRSVEGLISQGQVYDAATLLTRQRKESHCTPAIVAHARSLARDDTLAPMMRADLLGTAINCTLPRVDDAFLSDLGALDAAVSKTADPMRSVRVLLFAAELTSRQNDPKPLAKLVSAPDFIDRWMKTSPLMATLALLLDHASTVLNQESAPKKDRGASAYAMLCTLFPPGDRAALCADIEALKDSGAPAAVRKQRAQKALETVVAQITAPPKSAP